MLMGEHEAWIRKRIKINNGKNIFSKDKYVNKDQT